MLMNRVTLNFEEDHLKKVKQILRMHVPECEVRVFGSRLNGQASEYSDLDLAIISQQQLSWSRLEKLKEAFASSDLPIIIDVMDWHSISQSFREQINRQYLTIQRSPARPPIFRRMNETTCS